MDYEESRRYQSGDDPRYMNWQLSARTGQHYMKVFREERQPDVFILVDRRSTMRFGTQTRLKITQAARAATIVALSAQQNNLSVGGVIVSAELQWFKTNRNKQAIFDFIHQLARPARPAFTSPDIAEPSLAETLKLLNEILISGSIIYLVSDFLYRITEPALRPIRRFLPNLGGIDVSPVILILIILFLQNVIARYIYPNVF